MLNLLIGVGYTTIYASRLASPSYTHPIDTIEDFVRQGNCSFLARNTYQQYFASDMYWATRHAYRPILQSLNESKNPFFKNMVHRLAYFNTKSELHEALKTRKYGVLLALLQNHKAMDIEGIGDLDLWKFYRFMKACSFGFYTTFALNKHSPYTIIFNANMRK